MERMSQRGPEAVSFMSFGSRRRSSVALGLSPPHAHDERMARETPAIWGATPAGKQHRRSHHPAGSNQSARLAPVVLSLASSPSAARWRLPSWTEHTVLRGASRRQGAPRGQACLDLTQRLSAQVLGELAYADPQPTRAQLG